MVLPRTGTATAETPAVPIRPVAAAAATANRALPADFFAFLRREVFEFAEPHRSDYAPGVGVNWFGVIVDHRPARSVDSSASLIMSMRAILFRTLPQAFSSMVPAANTIR